MTYAELRQQIALYMHRTDLTPVLPGFVDKARTRINRDLRTREMIKTTALTPLTNPSALPNDFAEMRDIYYVRSSFRQSLEMVGRKQLDSYANPQGSNQPLFYSIDGLNIETSPGGIDTEFTLIYYAANPPLVADADTNLSMTVYPGIWLYAGLIEAHSYAQDLELQGRAAEIYTAELGMANQRAAESESGASIQMSGASNWR